MGYAEPSGKGPDGKPTWRARWQLPERNEKGRHKEGHKGGFSSPDDAKDYARDQEALIRAGLYVDPNAGNISLTSYFEIWLPMQRVKGTTRRFYRQMFNREIKPVWGGTPLAEIRTARLLQWLADLNDPRSPQRRSKSAIDSIESILNKMFTLAVFEDRLRKSPLPPQSGRGGQAGDYKPVREGQLFTRDEFAGLLANVPAWQDVVFCITMLFTGMRVSEMAAMDRGFLTLHVPEHESDRAAGTYYIDPHRGQIVTGEDYKLEFASPKSSKGRTLDLPPFHVLLLADWLGRIPADRERLFAGHWGGLFRVGGYYKSVWRPACDGREAYNTPRRHLHRPAIPSACPGKVPHDCRHTNKTEMSNRRVHETMQNYALGHAEGGSSAPYKHPSPEMRRERVDALQDWWLEWAIDVSALPAWHAADGPGGVRHSAISAPAKPSPPASTPKALQEGQPTLF